MTIDDLYALRWLEGYIDSLCERLQRLRAAREGASSWKFGLPRGNLSSTDRMADYMEQIEALEVELTERLIELERGRIVVEQAIAKLPARYQPILRLYYVDGLTWDGVADEVGYASSSCRRLRDEALILLEIAKSPKDERI